MIQDLPPGAGDIDFTGAFSLFDGEQPSYDRCDEEVKEQDEIRRLFEDIQQNAEDYLVLIRTGFSRFLMIPAIRVDHLNVPEAPTYAINAHLAIYPLCESDVNSLLGPNRPTGVPALRRDELLRCAVQVAITFHLLHEIGHLHRDLKAGNVLKSFDGRYLLADFTTCSKLGLQPQYESDRPLVPKNVDTPSKTPLQVVRVSGMTEDDYHSMDAVTFEINGLDMASPSNSGVTISTLPDKARLISTSVINVPATNKPKRKEDFYTDWSSWALFLLQLLGDVRDEDYFRDETKTYAAQFETVVARAEQYNLATLVRACLVDPSKESTSYASSPHASLNSMSTTDGNNHGHSLHRQIIKNSAFTAWVVVMDYRVILDRSLGRVDLEGVLLFLEKESDAPPELHSRLFKVLRYTITNHSDELMRLIRKPQVWAPILMLAAKLLEQKDTDACKDALYVLAYCMTELERNHLYEELRQVQDDAATVNNIGGLLNDFVFASTAAVPTTPPKSLLTGSPFELPSGYKSMPSCDENEGSTSLNGSKSIQASSSDSGLILDSSVQFEENGAPVDVISTDRRNDLTSPSPELSSLSPSNSNIAVVIIALLCIRNSSFQNKFMQGDTASIIDYIERASEPGNPLSNYTLLLLASSLEAGNLKALPVSAQAPFQALLFSLSKIPASTSAAATPYVSVLSDLLRLIAFDILNTHSPFLVSLRLPVEGSNRSLSTFIKECIFPQFALFLQNRGDLLVPEVDWDRVKWTFQRGILRLLSPHHISYNLSLRDMCHSPPLSAPGLAVPDLGVMPVLQEVMQILGEKDVVVETLCLHCVSKYRSVPSSRLRLVLWNERRTFECPGEVDWTFESNTKKMASELASRKPQVEESSSNTSPEGHQVLSEQRDAPTAEEEPTFELNDPGASIPVSVKAVPNDPLCDRFKCPVHPRFIPPQDHVLRSLVPVGHQLADVPSHMVTSTGKVRLQTIKRYVASSTAQEVSQRGFHDAENWSTKSLILRLEEPSDSAPLASSSSPASSMVSTEGVTNPRDSTNSLADSTNIANDLNGSFNSTSSGIIKNRSHGNSSSVSARLVPPSGWLADYVEVRAAKPKGVLAGDVWLVIFPDPVDDDEEELSFGGGSTRAIDPRTEAVYNGLASNQHLHVPFIGYSLATGDMVYLNEDDRCVNRPYGGRIDSSYNLGLGITTFGEIFAVTTRGALPPMNRVSDLHPHLRNIDPEKQNYRYVLVLSPNSRVRVSPPQSWKHLTPPTLKKRLKGCLLQHMNQQPKLLDLCDTAVKNYIRMHGATPHDMTQSFSSLNSVYNSYSSLTQSNPSHPSLQGSKSLIHSSSSTPSSSRPTIETINIPSPETTPHHRHYPHHQHHASSPIPGAVYGNVHMRSSSGGPSITSPNASFSTNDPIRYSDPNGIPQYHIPSNTTPPEDRRPDQQ